MNKLKEEGVYYTRQCAGLNLPYSSVSRWRSREREGREPIMAPGPKKVEPLDVERLAEEIRSMKHRSKRTHGTDELYERMKARISRRELLGLVSEARKDFNRQRLEQLERMEWQVPGMVWSMDDTEYKASAFNQKVYIHTVRDLGSRYIFDPPSEPYLLPGIEVAANLEELFRRYGAPLFLKRDGGGNLNEKHVNALLNKYMVIPLNSPPGYPQFNGSVEKAQHEIKQALKDKEYDDLRSLKLGLRLSVYELNSKPRRVLKGRMAGSAFEGRRIAMKQYIKRKRRSVYDELKERSAVLLEEDESCWDVDSAWRLAVKTWLLNHNVIKMKGNPKCYPLLDERLTHN